jgi:hypothetical protein
VIIFCRLGKKYIKLNAKTKQNKTTNKFRTVIALHRMISFSKKKNDDKD